VRGRNGLNSYGLLDAPVRRSHHSHRNSRIGITDLVWQIIVHMRRRWPYPLTQMKRGNVFEFDVLGNCVRGLVLSVNPLRVQHLSGPPPGNADNIWTSLPDDTSKRQLECTHCGGRGFKMGSGDKGIVVCLKNHAVGTADCLSVVKA
jgi:hypothetical protein